MKIGLIDVDGHNFPNLVLIKLSSFHKRNGDNVEWYNPLFSGHMDIVYMSKVFTFTPDYEYFIDAEKIVKGGTGYYYPDGGEMLPDEIEHIYPDYDLYPQYCNDEAIGFLTRGCPRGCDFCIVKDKTGEGKCSHKVANIDEFWKGQKNINLCDPNMFASKDWKDLSQQLIDTKSRIEFNQGVDIRIMNDERIEMLKQMKINVVHFAWDRIEDSEKIIPKFKAMKDITGWNKNKMMCYVLCNFNTTHDQDLFRINTLRDIGLDPYVMIYEKYRLPKDHETVKLQRWCNNKFVFAKCKTFEEYKRR